MDVFPTEESLSLSFINNTNEILEETMLAPSFLHLWLELLEEQYDFGPVHISLPGLPGEKTFSSDSRTADFFERLSRQKANPGNTHKNDYKIIELPGELQPGFIGVHRKNIRKPLFPVFTRYAPFYLKLVQRLEGLSAKLKLARLSLDLQSTAQELYDTENKPEENARALLETFLDTSHRDHAFVYYPEEKQFIFSENAAEIIEQHKVALNAALKNALHERSIFRNEEFHPSIKGLILYPLFSRDDLFAIFGCFNNTNPLINDFDISCVCNFCTNIANITNLANLTKTRSFSVS